MQKILRQTNANIRKKIKKKIEDRKDIINKKGQFILKRIETKYYNLREEEIKFSSLARKLGLSCNIIRLEDTDMPLVMNEVSMSIQTKLEQTKYTEKVSELYEIRKALYNVEKLLVKEIENTEYSKELKEVFAEGFYNKVQDLIKEAEIENLEKEKKKLEREYISIFGRIMGKAKLRQAKIINLELKKQLLIYEKREGKDTYTLEDGLADLYLYINNEGNRQNNEIAEFLKLVENDLHMKEMINKEKLKIELNKKMELKPRDMQLIPLDENKKISARAETNIIEIINSELGRQIQNMRAKTVTSQNRLALMEDKNSTLNKLKDIFKKMKLVLKMEGNIQRKEGLTNL